MLLHFDAHEVSCDALCDVVTRDRSAISRIIEACYVVGACASDADGPKRRHGFSFLRGTLGVPVMALYVAPAMWSSVIEGDLAAMWRTEGEGSPGSPSLCLHLKHRALPHPPPPSFQGRQPWRRKGPPLSLLGL